MMQTREQCIKMCLSFPDAYEDYPFDDDNWTVMRHRTNKKIFACIFEHQGKLMINCKADPMAVAMWQDMFREVIPAYHMNKTHWLGIIIDGKMKDEDVYNIVADSYGLTLPRVKGKKWTEN